MLEVATDSKLTNRHAADFNLEHLNALEGIKFIYPVHSSWAKISQTLL
jgi:hypothetical protein